MKWPTETEFANLVTRLVARCTVSRAGTLEAKYQQHSREQRHTQIRVKSSQDFRLHWAECVLPLDIIFTIFCAPGSIHLYDAAVVICGRECAYIMRLQKTPTPA